MCFVNWSVPFLSSTHMKFITDLLIVKKGTSVSNLTKVHCSKVHFWSLWKYWANHFTLTFLNIVAIESKDTVFKNILLIRSNCDNCFQDFDFNIQTKFQCKQTVIDLFNFWDKKVRRKKMFKQYRQILLHFTELLFSRWCV